LRTLKAYALKFVNMGGVDWAEMQINVVGTIRLSLTDQVYLVPCDGLGVTYRDLEDIGSVFSRQDRFQ
jgi:hypothetical protein